MSELLQRAVRFLRHLFTEETPPSPRAAAETGAVTGAGPPRATSPDPGSAEAPGTGVHLISHPTSEQSAHPRVPDRSPLLSPGGDPPEDLDRDRRRFLLSVDGAGQTLVVLGERMTIGHLRGGGCDLPFLADVGALHAELFRMESLREGSVWSIRPLRGEPVEVDGHSISEAGCILHGDARVQLGENLSFVLRTPDHASCTVLLELGRGTECGGAETIALFGDGPGGRLRIGAAEQRHIRVANLDHEISLVVEGDKMQVRCDAGVGRPEDSTTDIFSLPCPPPQRVDLQVGKSVGGRPPFSLVLSPVDLPGFSPPEGSRA
jgi:hypothetical protein